jgi:hypothetical protein
MKKRASRGVHDSGWKGMRQGREKQVAAGRLLVSITLIPDNFAVLHGLFSRQGKAIGAFF